MTEVFNIPGLGKRHKHPTARYTYAEAKSKCGACGGLGIPWGGWFSCEECPAVALVSTGEVFIPISGENNMSAKTIKRTQLDDWFTYHKPNDDQAERYVAIRDAARVFAGVVVDNTPAGQDQASAVQKIRVAVMVANQGIACEVKQQRGHIVEITALPQGRSAEAQDLKNAGWDGPGWYFWDETQAHCHGPFGNRDEANAALILYGEHL